MTPDGSSPSGSTAASSCPGGGCNPGEPPELALIRKIREEIGYEASALRHRATAVQHFNADGVSYSMTADFYTVSLGDRSAEQAEHDIAWLDSNDGGDRCITPTMRGPSGWSR
jgi:ADP-ribose pyrophosphatase YjhB (NUDIX family)